MVKGQCTQRIVEAPVGGGGTLSRPARVLTKTEQRPDVTLMCCINVMFLSGFKGRLLYVQ